MCRVMIPLGLVLFLLATVWLAVDDKPKLQARAQLSPAQIGKVKRLFDRNDPRRLRSGSMVLARLGQDELDLALNYAANQYANAVTRLSIQQGKALFSATLPLPANVFGRYLNLQVEFQQTEKLPEINTIWLGSVPVPAFMAGIFRYGLTALPLDIDWQQLIGRVKKIQFLPGLLLMTYQWNPDLPGQLGGALLSVDEVEQIRVYQNRLSDLSQIGKGTVTLTQLLQPLFQLAAARSEQGNAVQENRAVIRSLVFYVLQKELGKLAPEVMQWPHVLWRSVTLQQRDDLTKHYLVSAFLAADAGTPLADAVGLYKEMQDSRGGSGFSFNDLAADMAGTRLGEMAVANQESARLLQSFLAGAGEADIMPETADLPEFLSAAEFKRRFGGQQGEAYQQMMQMIERRIAALAINRKKIAH